MDGGWSGCDAYRSSDEPVNTGKTLNPARSAVITCLCGTSRLTTS